MPRRDPLRDAAAAQRVAARHGFDWPPGDPRLWRKLAEEIGELRRARHDPRRAREELGDLLFMAVNLARHLRLDASSALAGAVRKFERRFAHVLAGARGLPRRGDPGRLDAMEARWQDAKRRESRASRARVRSPASTRGSRHAHRTGR